MNYCPHCNAIFWHIDALAEHRKVCKVWAGEKKKPAEPAKPAAPDPLDDWKYSG